MIMNKHQELISKRTNEELIRDWIILDTLAIDSKVVTVRGWLMDEIEKRWPEEFDKWIDNCDKDDNIENYIKLK